MTSTREGQGPSKGQRELIFPTTVSIRLECLCLMLVPNTFDATGMKPAGQNSPFLLWEIQAPSPSCHFPRPCPFKRPFKAPALSLILQAPPRPVTHPSRLTHPLSITSQAPPSPATLILPGPPRSCQSSISPPLPVQTGSPRFYFREAMPHSSPGSGTAPAPEAQSPWLGHP